MAVRHLAKNRSYAALNILGLSIGLACFTLIALWVKDELSYDRFHAKTDRIYRVANLFKDESGQFEQAVTPVPLAPALLNDLPEVEDAVRIDPNGAIVELDDKQFVEDDILAVDPSFFGLFDFKLLRGTAKALSEPYSVVITQGMARKYFGERDPIGKSLRIFLFDPDGIGAEYKITGIIEDCPANSHFNYNFLVSFKTLERYNPDAASSWYNNGYYTYMPVKPDANMALLESKMSTFLEKYIGKEMKQYKVAWTYFLQPLATIHLNSNIRYEIKPTSSVSNVVIFASIGFIVLLLACINYINLATAYAKDRLKEVGVRKVMGALKNQLIGQHLMESWLLAMLSLIVGVTIIEIVRPLFESLTGRQVEGLYEWKTLITLVGITSLAGLLSGIYPALAVSSFRTVHILKGHYQTGNSGVWLRKALVVLQYSITIVLITGILVVQLQLQFINNKDLGFNEENLLIVNVNGSADVIRGFGGFRQEMEANPDITGIARSNTMITGGLGNSGALGIDASGKTVNATVFRMRVDHNYLETYGMKLLAGRNFDLTSASDSAGGFIINEATTRLYGYDDPADMVGTKFHFNGNDGQIIGVVADFHYNSLQQKIEPTCMYLLDGHFSRIAIRMQGNIHTQIKTVSSAWKKHFPESLLEYSFAEDTVEGQYQAERRFSRIFSVFSVISLAIACLGLFSLVSYSVQGRTKEIGIRKVLGASVSTIVAMISREFLVLIIVACIIAVPIGYYFMDKWLESFAYHIVLEFWVFILAGITALLIAMFTISLKSIRSALANPVDSLRNE